MDRIVPPVFPYAGTRDMDAWGSGTFGAKRDEGTRMHMGRDFISTPGDQVVAVFPGIVTATGYAYPNVGELHSLWLEGEGAWKHWRAQYLYVRAQVAVGVPIVGQRFDQGEVLGHAEDVAAYYHKKDPTHGPMTNHVHLMLLGPYDPFTLLPADAMFQRPVPIVA